LFGDFGSFGGKTLGSFVSESQISFLLKHSPELPGTPVEHPLKRGREGKPKGTQKLKFIRGLSALPLLLQK
jgi:hypothetical protein